MEPAKKRLQFSQFGLAGRLYDAFAYCFVIHIFNTVMSRTPGVITRLWVKWKSLNLPWRRQKFAGLDLSGTTFWEFKDTVNGGRMRRIAKYPRSTQYSDVKISPMWLQWLRHTRAAAPTIEEQEADAQRQVDLKQLSQLADERWNSKQSYLDNPKETAQPAPLTAPDDKGGYPKGEEPKPFKAPRGPGEDWQPEAWQPGRARR